MAAPLAEVENPAGGATRVRREFELGLDLSSVRCPPTETELNPCAEGSEIHIRGWRQLKIEVTRCLGERL